MWSQLSQDELTAHIDTQIKAIEASAAKAPPQRIVSGDQAGPAIDSVFISLGASANAVLSDLANGKASHTDDEACAALRAFHDAEIALPAADLSLVARYSASP